MKLVDNEQKVVYIPVQKMGVILLEWRESMESTELKKWIWRIVRFVWNIFALFGVFVCGYFLYLVFDEEGYCLSSQQGVWDNEQKICRKDCIKWSQEQGCITEKMLEGDTE